MHGGPTAHPVTGVIDYRPAALAPDGGALFVEASPGHLVRYRIEGNVLTLADATAPIANGGRGAVCVSPDGQWVCLPSTDGHEGLAQGLYVHRADDLRQPAFPVQTGAGTYVVAFDPSGGRIYAQNADQPLLLFDINGRPGPEVPSEAFPDGPHDVIQFLPHPHGRGLLMVTTESIFLVEFPGAEQ
jgi:hypothetical protein